MKCSSLRARADKTEDGHPVVSISVGNMRRVGAVDEVAWMEIPPGMAEEIARNLFEAAAEVRRALSNTDKR